MTPNIQKTCSFCIYSFYRHTVFTKNIVTFYEFFIWAHCKRVIKNKDYSPDNKNDKTGDNYKGNHFS